MTTGATLQEPAASDDADDRTCLWNDSASLQELGYAIDHGAVGATCNPVIVVDVLKREMHLWKERIQELIRRDAHGDRARHRVARRGRDVDQGRGAAEADLRCAQRPQRPAVGPDRPALLPRRRRHRAPGGALRRSSPPTSSSRSRSRPPAFRRSRRRPTAASASTPPSVSRCRSVSRWPRRWSAA